MDTPVDTDGTSPCANSKAEQASHFKTLLDAVAAAASEENLRTLLQALSGDNHALVFCRHHGAIGIVRTAWRASEADATRSALAGHILLLYAPLHRQALQRLGIAALCEATLKMHGPQAVLAPVARLWLRLGGPSTSVAMSLLAPDDAHIDVVRPLLRGLLTQKSSEALQNCKGAKDILEKFLTGPMGAEVMPLLCRISEPLPLPSAGRGEGGNGGQGSDESGSEASDDNEEARPVLSAGSFKDMELSTNAEVNIDHTPDARASRVEDMLGRQAEEAMSGLAADRPTEEPLIVPPIACADFSSHLALTAAQTQEWEILFPGPGGHGLSFSTGFEGANLHRVRWQGDNALEVVLSGDTNMSTMSRWFYFEITAVEEMDVRIHIVSCITSAATFSDGQRVVAMQGQEGWRRAGTDYAYYPNRYSAGGSSRQLYTLAFNLHFAAGRNRVAYFYPYLLGDLLADLRRLRPTHDCLDIQDIGPTPEGRPLLAMAITDFSMDTEQDRVSASKPCICISARVHPAEAPSSFVMRGALSLLLSDADEAKALRQRFYFAIMPFLNPDGVAVGNSRANYAGYDLNRCWERPPEGSEIVHARAHLEALRSRPGGVLAYVDLHAHSRMHGAFTLSNPGGTLLPDLLAAEQETSGSILFSRSKCSFKCMPSKRGSARCVAWRRLGIRHAHTLEATYAGMPDGSRLVEPEDLQALGRSLVTCCAQLADHRAKSSGGGKAGARHLKPISALPSSLLPAAATAPVVVPMACDDSPDE